ncbi:virulence RhuM family protein [Candidatus Gracilibacteria bacterium]|nr:virulence RhuM family protein [Candidatus Gracilibacteria bacterium]NUJ98398.1 virulence RhuM family protein [Candidatus Gracilibacteria bacterium]
MSEINSGEIIFYNSEEGDIKINVIFENETIWLSQKQMGELFDTSKQNISLHLQNCFETGEINEEATVKNFLTVQKEGEREVKREVTFYNLDAIIAVGYRVNSYKATKFRIWATNVLKEYVIKGFVMDDERLKNGSHFGKDYFEELLARIREIRASERRFYQKITDIYATSVDYDSKAQITKDFFAEVQNKFLFAVSGSTAPELEYHRSDSSKPNMGLTTWKSQKTGGKILTTDIKIGKNYLTEEELTNLNLLVSGYLDFAELQARNGKVMKMQDWIDKTRSFLELNDMKVLDGKGTISKIQAEEKVEKEFEKFRVLQDKEYIGDFDKFVKEVTSKSLK